MLTYRVIVTKEKIRWYLNDRLHRVDGPAVEYADGTKRWFLNGKRHREDGPAIEYADGEESSWYLNGERATESDVMNPTTKELTMSELETLLGHKVKIIK